MTVKSGKIKIQILDIGFEYTSKSYTTYVSEITTNRSLNDHFPISSFPESDWKDFFQILNTTKSRIGNLNSSLQAYILNFSEDYNF